MGKMPMLLSISINDLRQGPADLAAVFFAVGGEGETGEGVILMPDRVGHRKMETTLGYARVTTRALAEMESKLESQGSYAGWK